MTHLSAQQGAQLAFSKKESDRLWEEQQQNDSRIVQNMTRPVQEAINRAAQIPGVDFSFTANDLKNRVYAVLSAGNKTYAVIINPEENGYAIYKQEPHDEYRVRDYAEYEGKGDLTRVLGGIAMILGYHYPEHASAIDQAIQGQPLAHSARPPTLG